MQQYQDEHPTRDEVDAMRGPAILQFGNDWCGHCRRAAEPIARALEACPDVPHLKLADARERPLGRTFAVKLWPTLIFLRDGHEVARVVRPVDAQALDVGLAALREPPPG